MRGGRGSWHNLAKVAGRISKRNSGPRAGRCSEWRFEVQVIKKFSKNDYIYLDLPAFRYLQRKLGSFCNFDFFLPQRLLHELRELTRIDSREGHEGGEGRHGNMRPSLAIAGNGTVGASLQGATISRPMAFRGRTRACCPRLLWHRPSACLPSVDGRTIMSGVSHKFGKIVSSSLPLFLARRLRMENGGWTGLFATESQRTQSTFEHV
jgi:hypothetical protein